MRILKLALLSSVFLFILITLISLLIPSHIRISKAIDLKSSNDSAYFLIADKDKWPLWHPAYKSLNDSAQTKWVKQTSWKKKVQNDSLIIVELQQKDKMPITNGWQFYHHNDSQTTTLQWYMDFDLPWYPWQKFSSLFFEGTYGRMMEIGLNNLKQMEQSHLNLQQQNPFQSFLPPLLPNLINPGSEFFSSHATEICVTLSEDHRKVVHGLLRASKRLFKRKTRRSTAVV